MKNILLKIILLALIVRVVPASDYFPLIVNSSWFYSVSDTNNALIGYDSVLLTGTFNYRGLPVYEKKEYFYSTSMKLVSTTTNIFGNVNYLSRDNYIYWIPYDTSLFILPSTNRYYNFEHIVIESDRWMHPKFNDSVYVVYKGSATVSSIVYDSCYFLQCGPHPDDGYLVAPNIGVVKYFNTIPASTISCELIRSHILETSIQRATPIQAPFLISSFPNPFCVSINMASSNRLPFSVVIRDIQGRVIYKTNTPENHFDWTPNNLSNGYYFVQYKTLDNVFQERILYMK